MKTEIQDIAVEAVKASPGVVASVLTLNNIVAVASLVFVILQCAYLIRKWVREETEWGVRLKRLVMGKPTQPGDLE